jgi:hypothetical protein
MTTLLWAALALVLLWFLLRLVFKIVSVGVHLLLLLALAAVVAWFLFT